MPATATTTPPAVAALSARVAALPETTRAEQHKKVLLRVALERAELALAAVAEAPAVQDYAATLLTEVAQTLPVAAGPLLAPAPEANLTQMSTLKPVPHAASNPYLAQLVAGVRADLAKPAFTYQKALPDRSGLALIPKFYGPRDLSYRFEALVFLVLNPASPLHDDPEVLALLLRHALAYTDTLATAATLTAGKDLLDDFAITPGSIALREFAALRPGLLLPSQRAQWDLAVRRAGDAMMGKAKGRTGDYANIDICLGLELLNLGLHLRDDTLLEQSRFLIHAQEKNIFPDGAMAYLGHQNECPSYQGVVVDYLRRYLAITGDPRCLDMLRRLEPYERIINGPLLDWWTSPSWKHMWNTASWKQATNESDDPENDVQAAIAKGNRRWERVYHQVWTYDPADKPVPHPTAYTVLDRNLDGPRAWYDRWNYTATLRSIPASEPGHATLLGAQIATDEQPARLNAAVMGIYPRVSIQTSRRKTAWAWLTSDLQSALVVGRSFSAFTATYELATFGSSQKGEVAPGWRGRQLWLTLPDRVIGLLGLQTGAEGATALATGAVIRLGTGGTVHGAPQKIQARSPNSFAYGELLVTVLAHNFAEIAPVVVPFRVPAAPVTELTLRDQATPAAATEVTPEAPRNYPVNTYQWALVEIRPSWEQKAAKAVPARLPGGVEVLQVDIGDARYTLYTNPTAQPQLCALTPRLLAATPATLHLAGPDRPAPVFPCPAQTTLAPGGLALVVASQDAEARLPGWPTFDALLAAQPSAATTRTK